MNDEIIFVVKPGLGATRRSRLSRLVARNEIEKLGVAYKVMNGIQGIPKLDLDTVFDMAYQDKITGERKQLLEDNLFLLQLLKDHKDIIAGNPEAISRVESMIKRTVEGLRNIKEREATWK